MLYVTNMFNLQGADTTTKLHWNQHSVTPNKTTKTHMIASYLVSFDPHELNQIRAKLESKKKKKTLRAKLNNPTSQQCPHSHVQTPYVNMKAEE